MPKRRNFISIQHSSGMAAEGYEIVPLGTGAEKVIAFRTGPMFAQVALGKGKVIEKNDEVIVIEYDDPEHGTVRTPIGRLHGIAAGMTMPHDISTDLNVGDTVEEGHAVSYNRRFFKPDPMDPKHVVWMPGVLARTAFLDSGDTNEDSSVVSQALAAKLATLVTKLKPIKVNYDQEVHGLLPVGSAVDLDTILCTIEDPLTAASGLFDDESLGTLQDVAKPKMRANVTGTIDKVEVFYNGNIEKMSPSLLEITSFSDRRRNRTAKRLGSGASTGVVDGFVRIGGESLAQNQAIIRLSITGPDYAKVADKLVFCLQMKSTISRVMTGINKTEDGVDVDAFFGYESISARIVTSPEVMGTTNTILIGVGDLAIEAYDN